MDYKVKAHPLNGISMTASSTVNMSLSLYSLLSGGRNSTIAGTSKPGATGFSGF